MGTAGDGGGRGTGVTESESCSSQTPSIPKRPALGAVSSVMWADFSGWLRTADKVNDEVNDKDGDAQRGCSGFVGLSLLAPGKCTVTARVGAESI